MKAEIDMVNINKLDNVPSSLNNLKTKVDGSDFNKLKTVIIDFKQLSDVVIEKVLKKKMYKKLNTRVNNLENKVLHETTLIHIKQFNNNKIIKKKKLLTLIEKISDVSALMTTIVLNTKIGEVKNKVPNDAKYTTAPRFIKFAGSVFDTKWRKQNLATNNVNYASKCANKNKEKIEKIHTLDLSYFLGKTFWWWWFSKYVCLRTNV